MLKKIISAGIFSTAVFTAITASAFQFGKPITTEVLITSNKQGQKYTATPTKKNVVLMNYQLSPKEHNVLYNYKAKYNLKKSIKSPYPASVNLGMNDVPVLDQGYHGTCVTFAITAAVDALLKKGDYISQLCNLELGNYLEHKSFMPSGWQGSFGSWVLDQILRFGVVSKEKQTSLSCANVKEYPTTDFSNEGVPMSVGEFNRMGEDVSNNFYPIHYMNVFERFENEFNDDDRAAEVLNIVKRSLNRGNRVTFGTFILLSPYCSAGACASYKEKHDTWAFTSELQRPPFGTGGHEMVIYGYDDDAIAYDKDGNEHKGLLMLRNSWGPEVGDHGNYYMTYNYFMRFVNEVTEIAEYKFLQR